jgi:hypothetical protein|tara:strand:- start:1577 stop:1834 length:258 start_codon:yes stop_codon:yes gene_type:complete
MKVPGTVSITLEDYHALIDSAVKINESKEKLQRSAKELAVFLSFICTRQDISKHVQEFNKQSRTAKIVVEDNRATINFLDDVDNK